MAGPRRGSEHSKRGVAVGGRRKHAKASKYSLL